MSDAFVTPVSTGQITSDEKLLGLFSHLSLFLGGILLPFIFWLTNKDKSKFVTFHSLQALWFHIAYAVLIIVMAVFMLIGGAGISILTTGAKSNSPPVFMIVAIVAFYAFLFLCIFAGMGYSIYMAVKSYQGSFNRYPVIGRIVYNKVYGTNA